VVGGDGVLTTGHVVAGALAGDEARLLARVVRPGQSVAAWAPMRAVWVEHEWDLALLRLDRESQAAVGWGLLALANDLSRTLTGRPLHRRFGESHSLTT
jgi:Trypsin-like peptidase domain